MDFTPQGTIYLIAGVPLDKTYTNVIDFASEPEQRNYFMGKAKTMLETYTVVRDDKSIKVSINIEELRGVNYLMYKNYTGTKWIYCFINDKRYINEKNTEVYIETDVYQTYLFDHSLEHSFIEREHQNRWLGVNEPIYNVVDEGLTLGDEYIKEHEITVKNSDKYYLVVATESLQGETSDRSTAEMIQGYPTPFHYYVVPTNPPIGELGIQTLCSFLAGKQEVVSVSLLNYLPVNLSSLYSETVTLFSGITRTIRKLIFENNTPANFVLNPNPINVFTGLNIPSGFGVGTPKHYKYESKLLTNPYTFNLLTDFQTKPLVVKNEYLQNKLITVSCTQAISHQPKTKYYISSGYMGEVDGKNHSLINSTINDLPLINDVYLNYMQNNKASAVTGLAISTLGAGATLGVGLATGGLGLALGVGTFISAGSKIASEMSKRKDLQNTPDSVRNYGNNIAFDILDNNTALKLQRFSVHENIKKMLGDFFHMYGYKCMEVKKPNLRSRYYYNYIKTIGANIKGDMDITDLTKLKQIYDNGVTIWHNRSGVEPMNYSFDNVEMSLI